MTVRLVTLILCLMLLALAGCADDDPGRLQGYIEGRFTYVAAPAGGRLTELAVRRGDRVTAGRPLFRLEEQPEAATVQEARWRVGQAAESLANLRKGARPSEVQAIEARLRQAQSKADLSRREFRRREALYAQKAIPKSEYDSYQARFVADEAAVADVTAQLTTAGLGARSDEIKAAEAELRARQEALAKADWLLAQKGQSAALAALVFDTLYNVGEYVPAGSPVVVLLAPGEVVARFFVPEDTLASLRLGQEVGLGCDGCPPSLKARISYISPEAEFTPPVIYSVKTRHKLVYMVEASPDSQAAGQLHPGQPMDVYLPAQVAADAR